jgi:hypothetical protein
MATVGITCNTLFAHLQRRMMGRKGGGGSGGGAVLGNTILPGMAGASHIIFSLQYKQVKPTRKLANCLFLTFKTERKDIWKFGSIKGRQKSKYAHVCWGGDRKGCQVVNLPMLAGDGI